MRKNTTNIVTMSNSLARSGHMLSLSEKRLVMYAVSKLDARSSPKGLSPITKISASEYAEMFDIDMDTAYSQLKSACKQLYNRTLNFEEVTVKGGKKHVDEVNMRWVGAARYRKSEGWCELHWWHMVVPHLFNLKRQFTSYQLQQATALRSIYSWRLLELLEMCKETGWLQVGIEEFANAMDATEKQRQNFNNIKRRIIEPAIKELTEKDNWIINYEQIKAGRKVKALKFTFSKNKQGRLF